MYESASTGTRTDCLAKNAVIVDKYAVKAAVLLDEMPLVKRRSSRHINLMRFGLVTFCLLYTSPSPRDATLSRMPSSA